MKEIKIGDIVYFHGTFGVVTHVMNCSNANVYDIVTMDGSIVRQSILHNAPDMYQVYNTGLRFDINEMLAEIKKVSTLSFTGKIGEAIREHENEVA